MIFTNMSTDIPHIYIYIALGCGDSLFTWTDQYYDFGVDDFDWYDCFG